MEQTQKLSTELTNRLISQNQKTATFEVDIPTMKNCLFEPKDPFIDKLDNIRNNKYQFMLLKSLSYHTSTLFTQDIVQDLEQLDQLRRDRKTIQRQANFNKQVGSNQYHIIKYVDHQFIAQIHNRIKNLSLQTILSIFSSDNTLFVDLIIQKLFDQILNMNTKIEIINVNNQNSQVIDKDVIFSLNGQNVVVFQMIDIDRTENTRFFQQVYRTIMETVLGDLIQFSSSSFNIKSINLDFIETGVYNLVNFTKKQPKIVRSENKFNLDSQTVQVQTNPIDYQDELNNQIRQQYERQFSHIQSLMDEQQSLTCSKDFQLKFEDTLKHLQSIRFNQQMIAGFFKKQFQLYRFFDDQNAKYTYIRQNGLYEYQIHTSKKKKWKQDMQQGYLVYQNDNFNYAEIQCFFNFFIQVYSSFKCYQEVFHSYRNSLNQKRSRFN